jgi:hypothetical protein
MSAQTQTAPTVTLFGDRDALDTAVSDELGRRGCSTHTVTIPVGWLGSVSYAVIRVGTRSGREALAGLLEQDDPRTRVVAVCESMDDLQAFADLQAMCRRCGEHHDIALIVHAPLEATLAEISDLLAPTAAEDADHLARAIVDQMSVPPEHGAPPQFVERPYVPSRHG